MKQQVARLSPHQNAKVIAVMMALTSLVFVVPLLLVSSFAGPGARMPFWMFIVLPVFYLIFGYIAAIIGCAIYNVVVPVTGGLEYETVASAGA